jgi:peptidoglycan-associated lipoprotein
MRISSSWLTVVAVSALVACGGKQPPEQPAPQATPVAQPQPSQPVAAPASDDSQARQRAEAEEKARRDREAADARARSVAALRDQLTAMINFEFDKADVMSGDDANLDRKSAILSANGAVRLRISGHADERGSDEYNLALGNRRAAAAKRYLVNKGVDAVRLDVISYGEERPLDPGHDENSWARNRRDEFEITSGGDNLVAPR